MNYIRNQIVIRLHILSRCECNIHLLLNIFPDIWTNIWVTIFFIMRYLCFIKSSLLITVCIRFPNNSIPSCCKHGYGIKQHFVAFFGGCHSLLELADKAPMIFMLQKPDYPLVHWLLGWCRVWWWKFHSHISQFTGVFGVWQQYFLIFGGHSSFCKSRTPWTVHSYLCITVPSVCTLHGFHLPEAPWLLWLITSNSILSDLSIFPHTRTIILSLLLLSHESFHLCEHVLSGSRAKNNPHSPSLNISFGWYTLRSDGNTPVFQRLFPLQLHLWIPH
jgi:hypothetical protein